MEEALENTWSTTECSTCCSTMSTLTPRRTRALQDAVERGWFAEDCSMCRGVVDFQRALALAQQIAEGMAFLHANSIVHGVRGGLRPRVFVCACSEGWSAVAHGVLGCATSLSCSGRSTCIRC